MITKLKDCLPPILVWAILLLAIIENIERLEIRTLRGRVDTLERLCLENEGNVHGLVQNQKMMAQNISIGADVSNGLVTNLTSLTSIAAKLTERELINRDAILHLGDWLMALTKKEEL